MIKTHKNSISPAAQALLNSSTCSCLRSQLELELELDRAETTSVCSSVSSLTDCEDKQQQQQQQQLTKGRKRFTITKAKTQQTTGMTPVTNDAISISFLSIGAQGKQTSGTSTSANGNGPKQVIQRALASLRPGGVFFVLDYKENDKIMKEIPQDLRQKWNLTKVPTNLETYYGTRLANNSSKRIVRWIGVKPRQQPTN